MANRASLSAGPDALRRLTAEHVAARALVDAPTLAEAMPQILEAICRALDWEHGALWTIDHEGGVLRCTHTWHLPGVQFEGFDAASRRARFASGVGLPGRVWSSGGPVWIPDLARDDNFPRGSVASREGLHAALGFPVMYQGSVRSVLEFFSREIREPDDDLLTMLGTVGNQIGLFLERRRAEEELDRFFKLSVDLLCVTDLDGRFTRLNPAWQAVLGYAPAELLGTRYQELLHPDDRHATAVEAAKLERGLRVLSFENRFRGKDGRYRWLLWTATPSPDSSAVYGAARDITERKESEHALARHAREQEELRRSLEEQAHRQRQLMRELELARRQAEDAAGAKGEFLANMSHEIRTPLNAIIGMTELALRSRLTETQREYLTAAKSASDALLALVNDVLDFSKIESRRLELEHTPFDPRELAEDTARMLAFRATEKGLELLCHLAPDLPATVVGDPGRLRQVLVNLLGNAIKFTEQGEIVLRAGPAERPRPGQIVLRFAVSDTGVGVPEHRRSEIFEAFEQADSSTTRRHGGTGLGLAIAARLVELMHGQIELTSDDGRGSTFEFTARFELPSSDAAAGARAPAVGLAGLRVLLVDDNETNRRILGEMLAGWRMRPVAVASGRAALAALAAARAPGERFGLVLTDDRMPGMRGLALARRARRLRGYRRTPVIVLTSVGSAPAAGRRGETAVTATLTKPVKQSDLLEAIAAAIGGGAVAGVRGDAAGPARRALRVLVAEDNAVNRKLVTVVLERRGHRVTPVADGGAALAAFGEGRAGAFDVVILDVQMPVLNGLEAARALRERERGGGTRVPILALTAHALKGDRDRCLAAGMDDYMAKPIDVDQLIAHVEALAAAGGEGPRAAVRPRPSTGPSAAPAFDEADALRRVDGDRALLKEVLGLFRTDARRGLRAIGIALRRKDAEALRMAAHTLKGSASMLGATAASQAALALERLAADGDPPARRRASAVLTRALAEFEREAAARGYGPTGAKAAPRRKGREP